MKKRLLGEILVTEHGLEPEQLSAALRQQASFPGVRLGELLVERAFANEEAVAKALATQLGLVYVDPLSRDPDPEVLARTPRAVLERHVALPLDRGRGGAVLVAMADPLDEDAAEDLRFSLQAPVERAVAPPKRLRQAIARHFDLEPQARRVLASLGEADRREGPSLDTTLNQAVIHHKLRRGGEAPYVELAAMLFASAIERGASDIHLGPQPDGLRVRFRMDGLLRDVLHLPPYAARPLVARLKVIAGMDLAEKRRPQDGKVAVQHEGRRVDLRVSVVPSQFGENAVIRVLNPDTIQQDLASLGWEPTALQTWYHMVSQTRGLVLCVGPTGSGKTTTLYATIHRLRQRETAIVTVEDPIEYTLPGIVQVQVNEKIGLTFAEALRSMLRQDPNVIVVGEIRDAETAEAATHAATTGHFVLSTLHTTQTLSTVVRLLELGVPPYLLCDGLVGVVAQRLVRRVCPSCAVRARPEREDWQRLGVPPQNLGPDTRRVGPGCPACAFTGYRGRLGIFEVLPITDGLRTLILRGADEKALWAQARAEGLQTLFSDAMGKVGRGLTTLEEVARVVPPDPWRQGAPEAAPPRPAPTPTPVEAVPPEPAPARPAPTPEPAPADDSPPTVLVVDDAEEIRQLVTITLEDDYAVRVARDGQEALDAIAQARPDVVVLDVMMPRLSGYEVCARLKGDPKTAELPVLMLSARGDRSHIKEGLRAGADDYLPKPFDPEELHLRLRALLRRAGRLPL